MSYGNRTADAAAPIAAPSRLKELRETLRIPQGEFARRAGLSLRGLRLIESGHHSPKLATARAIARALGTRVDVVFPESPEDAR